ncbi:hypothetical protein [Streptomyces sp. NBC_01104]|uniref:hypothetical protein n=1 Tax=Streptomyces sp. NBC_01104 TaxID=2903750 RepID=UPI003865CF9C|nr:hypothetical protein OG450_00040 [Streptomyces sp. NBC_01104]
MPLVPHQGRGRGLFGVQQLGGTGGNLVARDLVPSACGPAAADAARPGRLSW